MTRVLVVYDSKTGNTKKMAQAVADGARKVKGTKVIVLQVDKAKLSDLTVSDAIIIGSPTYFGDMSGKMKSFIDRTYGIYGRLIGKVGGAFTSSGGTACGAETTLLSIMQAQLIHGMIVQGRCNDKHYGPTAVESPNREDIGSCKELGERVARLAAALRR